MPSTPNCIVGYFSVFHVRFWCFPCAVSGSILANYCMFLLYCCWSRPNRVMEWGRKQMTLFSWKCILANASLLLFKNTAWCKPALVWQVIPVIAHHDRHVQWGGIAIIKRAWLILSCELPPSQNPGSPLYWHINLAFCWCPIYSFQLGNIWLPSSQVYKCMLQREQWKWMVRHGIVQELLYKMALSRLSLNVRMKKPLPSLLRMVLTYSILVQPIASWLKMEWPDS